MVHLSSFRPMMEIRGRRLVMLMDTVLTGMIHAIFLQIPEERTILLGLDPNRPTAGVMRALIWIKYLLLSETLCALGLHLPAMEITLHRIKIHPARSLMDLPLTIFISVKKIETY